MLNEDSLTSLLIGNRITCNVKKHPPLQQIALGLLTKTHNKIVNHLFDYSVTCNYDEVLRFRKSAAIAYVIDARKSCPSGYVRGIIQVITDNFDLDLDLHTPNGKAATHLLSIIETYPMFNHNNDFQDSDEFERIKWEQMSGAILGNEFHITHYNGAEEPLLYRFHKPNFKKCLSTSRWYGIERMKLI